MKLFSARAAIFAVVVAIPSVCLSNDINTNFEINKLLQEKGDFLISVSCSDVCIEASRQCVEWEYFDPPGVRRLSEFQDEEKRRVCTEFADVCDQTQRQCTEVYGRLSAASLIGVIESEEFGDIERINVPDRFYLQSTSISNCSNVTQRASKALSLTFMEGHSITVTRGVNTTNTISVGVNSQFNFGASSIGAQGSYTVAEAVSVSNASANSSSETTVISTNVNIEAEPGNETTATMVLLTREFRLPFRVKIVVDGPLIENFANYTSVNQLLSEEERTFVSEGFILATVGSEEMVEYQTNELQCGQRDDVKFLAGEQISFLSEDRDLEKATDFLDDLARSTDASGIVGLSHEELIGMIWYSAVNKVDESEKFPGAVAQGTHQCQSASSIGHSCSVGGYFANCLEAQLSLGSNDCCAATPNRGTSIGFSMNSCTPF